MKREQSTTILSVLIFTIAIMLSGSVFAQKTQKTVPANPRIYEIGKTGPAGGIVFHISDGGGSRSFGFHGLEAAPVDQGMAPWGCYATEITGADGGAVGTGAQNTADILAACTEPGIAADLAANYELNRYTDWFLPSAGEFELMRKNLFLLGLGGFKDGGAYWRSKETKFEGGVYAEFAYFSFSSFVTDPRMSKTELIRVRAIRAF